MPRYRTEKPPALPAPDAPGPGPEAEPSPAQEIVIARLVAGSTITDAARAAGVDRGAVHRWLRDDLVFGAAYNAARAEMRDATRAELRGLAGDAVRVLRKLMVSKTTPAAVRRQIAMDVLSAAGATEPAAPIGATDPEELRRERVEAERDWHRWGGMVESSMPAKLVKPNWAPLAAPEDLPTTDPVTELLGRLGAGIDL